MAINKVVYGNETLIDITEDTVNENNLLSGATAHDAAGNPIVGAVVVAPIDNTLSQAGAAADAKETGERLDQLSSEIDNLSNPVVEAPIFVNSIEEMTDQSKIYVLTSDGFIYKYGEKTVIKPEISYYNKEDVTSDMLNKRYSGTPGSLVATNGYYVTDIVDIDIPSNPILVLRVNGALFPNVLSKIVYLDVDDNVLASPYLNVTNHYIDSENGLIYVGYTDPTTKASYYDSIAKIRFVVAVGSSALTIDSVLDFTVTSDGCVFTETGWHSTGMAYVPADYESRIIGLEQAKVNHELRISNLEKNGVTSNNTSNVPSYWQTAIDDLKAKIDERQSNGHDCFQFVWFSDMHGKTGYNNTTNGAGQSSQTHLGAISQRLCEQYDIPFVALSGDIMSQASHTSESSVHQEYVDCSNILSPIDKDRLLATIGNHDGSWGAAVDGVYYLKDIGNRVLYNKVFRKQSTDCKRVFGGDGTYFFIDSNPQKIRFIMLNTNTDGDGSNNENGYAVYNSMKNFVLGSEQLQWLENVALDVPEGWGIVLMGHAQPKAWVNSVLQWNIKDCELLNGVLTAYKNRSQYQGASVDVSGEYWGRVGSYTNLFDISTVRLNTRVNSSHNEVAKDGMIIIPDLPFTNGDVLRINMPESFSDGNTKIMSIYGENSMIGGDGGALYTLPLETTDTEVKYTVGHYLKNGVDTEITQSVTKVNIALYLSTDAVTVDDIPDIVITKNEPIEKTSNEPSEYCTSTTVDKDFTNAKGELIAYFHGHIHKDSVDDKTWLPIPSIAITTAGGDVRDENPPLRTVGTDTETALDIVTIDKNQKKIFTTRLGAGSDREINY